MGRLLAVFIWVMTILSVAMFFTALVVPARHPRARPAYDQQYS